MDGVPPSILIGRISEVGPAFVFVGSNRIELPSACASAAFTVGASVTVTAVRRQDHYVAESILLNPVDRVD